MTYSRRVLTYAALAVALLVAFLVLLVNREPTRCYGNSRREAFSGRANGVILILCRNKELDGLRKTMPQFEFRFNHRYHYPYVFLNDEPFTEHFQTEVRKLTNSVVSFGTIPKEHWSIPDFVDKNLAEEKRNNMKRDGVMYGGSLSYQHMCRFNSGFFFLHPLLDGFEYYWRVEPYTDWMCDIEYDPFAFMKRNKKKYGFTVVLYENQDTIPTLWDTTKQFMREHKEVVNPDNTLHLVESADGSYNLCHYWSNFEIASLDMWRSPEYKKYFDYLDRKGGFFYERWGDAPVHSLFASMYLSIDELHHFEDIGYFHSPYYNCPANPALQLRCECDPTHKLNFASNHKCFQKFREMQYVKYKGQE